MVDSDKTLSYPFIRQKEGVFELDLYVTPGADRNKISGIFNNRLKLQIKKPPEKGLANKELISFLSKELKVKKNDIKILRGGGARNKTIAISNSCFEDLALLLEKFTKDT